MKKLGYALLLILLAPSISAADDTFPVGVPVTTQALFCLDLQSAQAIAENKGAVPRNLLEEKKCVVMQGVAVYVREVYRNEGWTVWELHSGNLPVFYEATNWKPRPNGISI